MGELLLVLDGEGTIPLNGSVTAHMAITHRHAH